MSGTPDSTRNMLCPMPAYIVAGFHQGTFRTFETKQKTLNDAIAHAEAMELTIESIRCHQTREVYHKVGREFVVETYQPTKGQRKPGEFTVLYVVSGVLPPVGLVMGGVREFCGMEGGRGMLIAAAIGAVVYGIGWMVISKML